MEFKTTIGTVDFIPEEHMNLVKLAKDPLSTFCVLSDDGVSWAFSDAAIPKVQGTLHLASSELAGLPARLGRSTSAGIVKIEDSPTKRKIGIFNDLSLPSTPSKSPKKTADATPRQVVL